MANTKLFSSSILFYSRGSNDALHAFSFSLFSFTCLSIYCDAHTVFVRVYSYLQVWCSPNEADVLVDAATDDTSSNVTFSSGAPEYHTHAEEVLTTSALQPPRKCMRSKMAHSS